MHTTTTATHEEPEMSVTTNEHHKQVVRRWVKEVFNEHNLDSVEKLKVPEYIDWDPYPGQNEYLRGFKSVLVRFFEAFPDFRYDVEEELVEGDMLVCLGRWSGTNTGTFMGREPTGGHLTGRRIDVVRFSGDKMTERWGTGPELQMLQLMGVVPPTTPLQDKSAKAVCRRFLDEVLIRRDAAAIDLLMNGGGALGTRDALGLLVLASAFSDVTLTADELIGEDDVATALITFTGTHTGELLGRPPTDRRVSAGQVLTLRVDDGRVVECSYDLGIGELVEQIAASGRPTTEGLSEHAVSR
jgi:predicted ester cyclase